jgi:hypothetical protein
MIAILIHNDLHRIDFDDLHNFPLHFNSVMSIFHDLLYNSAPVAVQTDKQKLLFGELVNKLPLFFISYLNVLLNNIVSKLIVD